MLRGLAPGDAHEGTVEPRQEVPVEVAQVLAGAVGAVADELLGAPREPRTPRSLPSLAGRGQARDQPLRAPRESGVEADAGAGELGRCARSHDLPIQPRGPGFASGRRAPRGGAA